MRNVIFMIGCSMVVLGFYLMLSGQGVEVPIKNGAIMFTLGLPVMLLGWMAITNQFFVRTAPLILTFFFACIASLFWESPSSDGNLCKGIGIFGFLTGLAWLFMEDAFHAPEKIKLPLKTSPTAMRP